MELVEINNAEQPPKKEKEKVWHKQQEDILKDWSEMAASYQWLHSRSYNKFKSQNMWFALPVIIISTVTGTANFAQSSLPTEAQSWAPAAIGFLNLTAGLITTVAQFLRVSEQMEGHRASSVEYGKLARNIEVELSLPAAERNTGGLDYIKQCRGDIDRLIEQSPDIPMKILGEFQNNVMVDLSGVDFGLPKILKLEPINVFREEDQKLMEIKKAKEKALIFEEEKRKRELIIKEEENRRKSIFDSEGIQDKLDKLKKMENDKKKEAEAKKNISINAISKTLGKLNSIMIGHDNSSDDDDTDNPPNHFTNTPSVIIDIQEQLEQDPSGNNTEDPSGNNNDNQDPSNNNTIIIG